MGEVEAEKDRARVGGVEMYIEEQKGYTMTDTVPIMDEEKGNFRAHEIGYITLYTNFLLLQAPYLQYGVCDSTNELRKMKMERKQ